MDTPVKRSIVSIVAGVLLGSIASAMIPGSMLTRLIVALTIFAVTMVVGICMLLRKANSEETHKQPSQR